jgi:hypothetical protein
MWGSGSAGSHQNKEMPFVLVWNMKAQWASHKCQGGYACKFLYLTLKDMKTYTVSRTNLNLKPCLSAMRAVGW